jgi:hypothetical protein
VRDNHTLVQGKDGISILNVPGLDGFGCMEARRVIGEWVVRSDWIDKVQVRLLLDAMKSAHFSYPMLR